MYDGFEYWFTSWDLNENRWSINPLIDGDVNLDSDMDSFDRNGDGEIDANETFSNLREWESRTWGKYLTRNTVPANLGIIDFGEDAMAAYQEELGFTALQAQQALYQDFVKKGQESVERMEKINELESENFNRSLRGVADPTHPDSDSDGIPDGWEYCYATYGMPDVSTQNHWAPTRSIRGTWITTATATVGTTGQVLTFQPTKELGKTGFSHRQGSWCRTAWVICRSPISWSTTTKPAPTSTTATATAVTYITTVENGAVVSHVRDYNYSDGREVFKYGSNPSDNDTDARHAP